MSALQAFALNLPHSIERERLVRELRGRRDPMLVLDTCQRLEIFAGPENDLTGLPVTDQWTQAVAFERLARIAAGLESRILGELEVLGQVRAAYKAFRGPADTGVPQIDRVFQEALSLARKARRKSGIDRGMISLSGLAAREILRRVRPGDPLAVIGTGSLASAVARHLSKPGDSTVRVCGRCPENAMNLALQVGGFGSGLDDLKPLLRDVAGVVSATAAPHPVIYPHHLEESRSPLPIVDLGVPADCSADVHQSDAIEYIGLEVIESRARGNADKRRLCAEQAAEIVRRGAQAWSLSHG
jgi:glutamyl-tRNA reductase